MASKYRVGIILTEVANMKKNYINTEVNNSINPDNNIVFSSKSGIELHGSIRLPKDLSHKHSAVLIISGSGPVDRNGNAPSQLGIPPINLDIYNWIADILAEQGIASLRYDKLTSGDTGLGPYASDPNSLVDQSFDKLFVEPAQDALTYLAKQPGIDPDKITILGHSEGGLIAMLISSSDKTILKPAGLVLAEPSYSRFLDIVARQLEDQIKQAKMSSNEETRLIDWVIEGVKDIRNSKLQDKSRIITPPIVSPSKTAKQWQDMIQAIVYQRMSNNLIKTEDEIDPCELAPNIKLPILITTGSKDFNTPPNAKGPAGSGVWALAQAFKNHNEDNLRYVELKNVVHILRDVGEQDATTLLLASQVKYPYSKQFKKVLEDFLSK